MRNFLLVTMYSYKCMELNEKKNLFAYKKKKYAD